MGTNALKMLPPFLIYLCIMIHVAVTQLVVLISLCESNIPSLAEQQFCTENYMEYPFALSNPTPLELPKPFLPHLVDLHFLSIIKPCH